MVLYHTQGSKVLIGIRRLKLRRPLRASFQVAELWKARGARNSAEWNSTAEVEKAPQGLNWDRSPMKAKTLWVLETRRGSRRMNSRLKLRRPLRA